MKIADFEVEVTSHRTPGGWICKGILPNGKPIISGPKISREEAEHDVQQQAKAHLNPQQHYDVNRPFESVDDDDDVSFSDVEIQPEFNFSSKIFLDANPQDAPGCYKIENEDGKDMLIQTDWDFPGIASTFGWSTRHVANGSTLDFEPDVDIECQGSDGTDGTVDCQVCGKEAGSFISEAAQFLDDNDGASADDPGYFGESIDTSILQSQRYQDLAHDLRSEDFDITDEYVEYDRFMLNLRVPEIHAASSEFFANRLSQLLQYYAKPGTVNISHNRDFGTAEPNTFTATFKMPMPASESERCNYGEFMNINEHEAKLGSGKRFAKMKRSVAHEKGVRDPGAVAATIGRKSLGKERFQKLAAAGRRRHSESQERRYPDLSPADEAVVMHKADQLLEVVRPQSVYEIDPATGDPINSPSCPRCGTKGRDMGGVIKGRYTCPGCGSTFTPSARTSPGRVTSLYQPQPPGGMPRPKASFYPSDGGSAGGGGGISSV